MYRVIPYPALFVFIVFMWMLLSGFTSGQLIIGVVLGIVAGRVMPLLQPEKVRVRNWTALLKFLLKIIVDITRSNLAVTDIILTGGRKNRESGFMIIPLDIENRTSLAILSCVLTATPGTAWVAYNSKNNELLLHVLDLKDEKYWLDLIKNRYEASLMEIFQ